MDYDCLSCLSKQIAEEKKRNGHPDGTMLLPEVRKAVTLAPSWQMMNVGGQPMVACVAVPSCRECLTVPSALEQAAGMGLALG